LVPFGEQMDSGTPRWTIQFAPLRNAGEPALIGRITGGSVRLVDDVTIRVERPEDHGAIAELVEAAFGSPAEARLEEAIRTSEFAIPELALVAERDGRVVGHVMISQAEVDHGDHCSPVAMLSPLAVAPGEQGHGIGSALVRDVTARAAALGEAIVVLEGSPAFYGRLGFEPAADHGLELPLPSWAPPEAAQVVKLSDAYPRLRGRVVYPPAFDTVAEHGT
jgi:putative acetyltransferase